MNCLYSIKRHLYGIELVYNNILSYCSTCLGESSLFCHYPENSSSIARQGHPLAAASRGDPRQSGHEGLLRK
jgi:hypothetical protein